MPPGRAPGDLAPDLGLAHERLRPEWIVRWLFDPQKIAPGTKMPTFFNEDPKDKTKRISQLPNILGGDAQAQMEALRDHVFSLGGKVSSSN
jgi:cbb3-type cytochrome oxidase cytochrome c subunit